MNENLPDATNIFQLLYSNGISFTTVVNNAKRQVKFISVSDADKMKVVLPKATIDLDVHSKRFCEFIVKYECREDKEN